MALQKLSVTPTQASYSVNDGREVVSIQLDGGAARYRRDILNANSIVSVNWVLDKTGFNYIRGFYRVTTASGSLPFLIDLIIDEADLTEHEAHFTPNSLKVTGIDGGRYLVSAELEVKPNVPSDDNISFIVLFGEYGSDYETLFALDEDIINQAINQEIPYFMQGSYLLGEVV